MRKTISLVVAIAAMLGTVVTAQETPAPQQTSQSSDPVVITAGDVTIRQSEFETALKALPAEYQNFARGPQKRAFAEDYLRMKLLAQHGAKEGLDKDPEVLGQLKLMKENVIANAALGKIEKSINVSDEDLKKIYESKKNEYEQVSARHILIAFKGSPAAQPGKKELTEEEAKAKAEDLRKQIVGGASFDEVAKKESDDVGSGSRGGDLGTFGRGQMVPEFEKAAFEGKVGEVSAPVRTQFGYHIIKVDKHDSMPFEQVKETLAKTEKQKMLQESLETMKTNAKPVFNEAFFAPPAPPQASSAPATNGDAKAAAAKPAETKKADPKKKK